MKCPGQDSQYWNASAIFEAACPKCGAPVEFYKDDASRRCPACGHRFVNPKKDFGCAAYCQFAEQCLGTLPEDFAGARDALLKDKVAVEVKRLLRGDFARIGALARAARHAETIAIAEKSNVGVVICSVFLQGIGQDAANQGVAAELLPKLGAKAEVTEQVLALLAEDAARDNGSGNDVGSSAAILDDARRLARLEETLKKQGGAGMETFPEQLRTATGREIASRLLAERAGK
ncbi:MAG: phosphohydrolase [Desulfobulbaceae bacterium]|jgi:DNA-directed RNA polymerase subunit RPC12/RpoP|nr:phosphohydrolase [Desulfobulbaceae bacterium]